MNNRTQAAESANSGEMLPLTRQRFGLRFADSATEQAYRQWRDEHILFLLMIGMGVSLLSWISAGVVIWFWLPDAPRLTFLVIAAIVTVFAIVLPLLWQPAFARLRTAMVAVFLLFLGLAVVGLMMLNGEPVAGFALALAAACSATIVTSFFAPVMQLPPLAALLAVIPSLGLVIGLAVHGYQIDLLDRFTVGVAVGYPVLVFHFVVMICVLVDRNNRMTFVNEMTIERQRESLSRSANLVRRYVPPAVAAHIFEGNEAAVDSPQRRRVTVLFSDIVGFTDMADRLDAESLTQILNEYMAAMADIVEAHGGTLNEFAGDGLMALFGAPAEMAPEAQAVNALHAAQAMQARLPALNEQWLKLGIGEPVQIRAGINTGVLSVGSFGSAGRMTYTAIGLQTNIAARIQAQCAPGGVLLSDASWHLVKDQIDCEARGEVECKGVHFPVKVYAPAAPPSLRGTK